LSGHFDFISCVRTQVPILTCFCAYLSVCDIHQYDPGKLATCDLPFHEACAHHCSCSCSKMGSRMTRRHLHVTQRYLNLRAHTQRHSLLVHELQKRRSSTGGDLCISKKCIFQNIICKFNFTTAFRREFIATITKLFMVFAVSRLCRYKRLSLPGGRLRGV